MLINRLLCSLLFAAILCSSVTQAQKKKSGQQEEWAYITTISSDNRKVYFAPKRTVPSENKAIKTWIKLVSGGPFSSFMQGVIRAENNLSTEGYDKYSHTMELVEINCIKRQARWLTSIDYDEKGEVLESRDTPESRWNDVVPDSIGETILEKVCVSQKRMKK